MNVVWVAIEPEKILRKETQASALHFSLNQISDSLANDLETITRRTHRSQDLAVARFEFPRLLLLRPL